MAALESVLIVTVIGGELWSVMSIAELCHPGPKLPLGVHVGVGVISEAFLDESAPLDGGHLLSPWQPLVKQLGAGVTSRVSFYFSLCFLGF